MKKRKPDSTTIPARKWSPEDLQYMRDHYPHVKAESVAAVLGRTVTAIHNMAQSLELRKTAEFFAGPDSGRTNGSKGVNNRFSAGNEAWNKGRKKVVPATAFKAGTKPLNWAPIGTERISGEGYLQRKMTDTGSRSGDWVPVHILVWEEAHGPVPPGHAVVFRDGDRMHIDLPNLEMITRAELLRRNSVHRYPPELKDLIRLKALVTRKINALDR